MYQGSKDGLSSHGFLCVIIAGVGAVLILYNLVPVLFFFLGL